MLKTHPQRLHSAQSTVEELSTISLVWDSVERQNKQEGTSKNTSIRELRAPLERSGSAVMLGRGRFRPICSLPAPLAGAFTPLYANSTHALSSSGRRHPLELHKAAHVVDQVHEPDLGASARHADGAHEFAAHGVLLIPKDVLDAGAHA